MELRGYLQTSEVDSDADPCVEWWRGHQPNFPRVAKLAQHYANLRPVRHPKKYSALVATLSRVTGPLTRCCGPSGVPCSQFVTAVMLYLWSTVGNISNDFQSAERSTKNKQKQNNDMYTVRI